MPEILLTFGGLSWQKGSAAQVIALVHEIRKLRTDISITLLSHYVDLDAAPAATLGIGTAGHRRRVGTTPNRRSAEMALWRVHAALHGVTHRILNTGRIGNSVLSSAYKRADLVLDLSGDSYRDPPGGRSFAHNLNLMVCLACGVPCALVSQSLGPFFRHNTPITRLFLNRSALIYVRENRSKQLLERMGVRTELLHLAPDIAFMLPAADSWRVQQLIADGIPELCSLPRPWIGISTSGLLFTRLSRAESTLHLQELLHLIEHIQHLGGTAVLVPHEIRPPQLGMDDVAAAERIRALLPKEARVRILHGDHDPRVIKGFISQLDAFVGCRMHAGIAALSSGVPAVLVSWSHKYEGVMEEIGLPQFVWSLRSGPGLVKTFDLLWETRSTIRRQLLDYADAAALRIRDVVDRILRIACSS